MTKVVTRVGQARGCEAVITLPRSGGGLQPLCAVYRRDFAAIAERALQQGRNKIDAAFTEVQVRVIDESELTRFAFSPAMFDNLNTREEVERARMRLDLRQ